MTAAATSSTSSTVWDLEADLGAATSQGVVDLRGYFKVEVYPHNGMVFREGDAMDRAYLVKRGRVQLLRVDRRGRRSLLAILNPGDIFGELSAGQGSTPAEERAVASGEAEVWSISGPELSTLVASQPSLALDLIRAQNARIRRQKRRLRSATSMEVPARLAETLLELGEELGVRCPHGGERDLRGVTQQDLADLLGASRSFVSTLVNEMKRDGYLGNVGRVLCIRDQAALRKIAHRERA